MTQAQPKPQSDIESLFQRARRIRDQKEELNRLLRDINDEQRDIDRLILDYLENENLDKVSIAGNTAIRSKKRVAAVSDWDAFFNYIATSKEFHFLQRRIASNAAVEAMDLNQELPGVEIQEFPDLGFRRG